MAMCQNRAMNIKNLGASLLMNSSPRLCFVECLVLYEAVCAALVCELQGVEVYALDDYKTGTFAHSNLAHAVVNAESLSTIERCPGE